MTQISSSSEYAIPSYTLVHVLGEGAYAYVFDGFKKDTKESVVVKVSKERCSHVNRLREVSMLENLKCLDPEKSNIIRYHECFLWNGRTHMVFEKLDISVQEYFYKRECDPLPLNGVRTIIKDIATALNALNGLGVIHTDLKLDNIMLVDHLRQPFRAKLIDFGLALYTYEAKVGRIVQNRWNRAPEIILGLPFTGAIDIWSLGTLMAELLIGSPLFPGKHEYDVLCFIIDLLGELPKRFLNEGRYTLNFYKLSRRHLVYKQWTLKTPSEFETETRLRSMDTRKYYFESLDFLKTWSLYRTNKEEAADWNACVDLLKEMLQVDPRKRITPSQMLAHPFITGSYYHPSNTSKSQDVQSQITDSSETQNGDLVLESVSDSELTYSTVESLTDSVSSSPSSSTEISSTPQNSPVEAPDDILTQASNNTSSLKASEEDEPKTRMTRMKKRILGFFSTLRRTFFSCNRVP